jgi:hypothetical protein
MLELPAPVHRPGHRIPERVLAAAVAVLGGLVVGIGTQVLQGVLPGSWGVLANSGVAWALAACAIGTVLPSDRAAALGGAVAMVLASTSYYWAVEWFEGIESSSRGTVIWSLAGLVAGPVFGVAGRWARHRPDRRGLALAPVAGVLVGEGIHLLWFVGVDDLWPAGLVELVLGAMLAVGATVRDRRPVVVLGMIVAAAALHHVATGIIDAGFRSF